MDFDVPAGCSANAHRRGAGRLHLRHADERRLSTCVIIASNVTMTRAERWK